MKTWSMLSSILFLPHGMQIIPGVEDDQHHGFAALDRDLGKLIENISEIVNENVILLTPHGYNLDDKITLYDHSTFNSTIYKINNNSVVYGEAWKSFQVNGNLELNDKLIKLANEHELNLEKLIHGYSGYPLQLNWGETVPLYYLNSIEDIKVSILCYPRTRHHNISQIQHLNTKLITILQHLEDNFTVVISGDLAHTHDPDGPYKFHKNSKIFDDEVMKWAENGKDKHMNTLFDYQDQALACGMAGLHLIHLLRKNQHSKLKHSFYKVPTYFGMAVLWWDFNNF